MSVRLPFLHRRTSPAVRRWWYFGSGSGSLRGAGARAGDDEGDASDVLLPAARASALPWPLDTAVDALRGDLDLLRPRSELLFTFWGASALPMAFQLSLQAARTSAASLDPLLPTSHPQT
mmetsp:Transcript_75183/g.140202  ORF Transcript_75183/g.140202 Transcript_75183/m.140202 type:complete len:120 (-) Transcript_75183:2-361(-)